jgi:hypothetical protein
MPDGGDRGNPVATRKRAWYYSHHDRFDRVILLVFRYFLQMTANLSFVHRLTKGDLSIIFYLSLLKLVVHLALNISGGYGLFRDEFYYVACANNLAAGYVDHPPLSAFILRAVMETFGDSLFSIRLIAALAGALTVLFTGLITLRLGGGKLATFIACLFCFSPINMAMTGYYSMNSIDILCWTLVAYLMILIIQQEKGKWWIVLGFVLGLGLLNKIGVLFIGAGLFAGLLATPHRKWFLTRGPYLTGVIALLCFLPYIIWNFQHSFAHLEFIRNASSEKYASQTAMDFLAGQIMMNNPVSILVWLPGVIALFTSEYFKPYRLLGWLYVVPLLIFVLNGTSKSEYLAPAYGMLYASGAIFWERQIRKSLAYRYALTVVIAVWVVVAMVALPLVLPVLPVAKYIAYAEAIGFEPDSSEGKELSELPQFYADMFGWKEKAKGVAEVFNTLSADEKKKVAIFSSNYGRCAAVDYYGEEYGLPKTIGNHNNYWIWGPRDYDGEILILLGGDIEEHKPDFREVELVSVIDCQYCMPYEDNVPVYLCRGLKHKPEEVWPAVKHYD